MKLTYKMQVLFLFLSVFLQECITNPINFGTGYEYQYGPQEGTIEIFMNEKGWVFATEEVRQEIQVRHMRKCNIGLRKCCSWIGECI